MFSSMQGRELDFWDLSDPIDMQFDLRYLNLILEESFKVYESKHGIKIVEEWGNGTHQEATSS